MIVVDTNIIAYRWLNSARTTQAEALVAIDPDWACPVLWRSEFRNVLAGFIRARKLSEPEAGVMISRAFSCLLGGEHSVADASVLALVARSNCTAYDCEFVALAQALGVLLVTDDRALLREFPGDSRSLDDAVRRGVR